MPLPRLGYRKDDIITSLAKVVKNNASTLASTLLLFSI